MNSNQRKYLHVGYGALQRLVDMSELEDNSAGEALLAGFEKAFSDELVKSDVPQQPNLKD